MLNWLTRGWRSRAACTLAAIYALCTIAPPVALAFTDGSVAAHCLFEDVDAAPHVHARSAPNQTAVHIHAAGVNHDHVSATAPIKSTDDQQGRQAESCCGLFSGAAVFDNKGVPLAVDLSNAPVLAVLDHDLDGRGSDRLYRPPIAL